MFIFSPCFPPSHPARCISLGKRGNLLKTTLAPKSPTQRKKLDIHQIEEKKKEKNTTTKSSTQLNIIEYEIKYELTR